MIVAVDGGASKCRLGAFNQTGDLCALVTEGPASLTLGEQHAWARIKRGLQVLASKLNKPSNWLPDTLVMGLAGSLQDSRRDRFLAMLPESMESILVTDGHGQLYGATGGSAGACLAVGTGSVLHWQHVDGSSGMAGGWGFPAGDEGSGAWLGRRLINSYCWYRDEMALEQPKPAVFALLENEIGDSVADIQSWSTSSCSTDIAGLAKLVNSAANQGDAIAGSLLDAGAVQCYRLARLAPDSLPVYLTGGLADVYWSRLASSLGERLLRPKADALVGLHRMALERTQAF